MQLYSLRRIGGKIVMEFGEWETDETLFKQEISKVKKGWTVVDVGSEFGYYSIKAAHLIGKCGKVIAIEPHPLNYQVLIKNLSYYKLDNVLTVPKAAGAKKEKRRLYEAYDLGGTSILPRASLYNVEKGVFHKWMQLIKSGGVFKILRQQISVISNSYSISVDTLDNIMRECNVNKVDLIKIDVEGAELEVLKGSLNLLKRYKPILLIEVHDQELGRKTNLIYELLVRCGYTLRCEQRPFKTLVVGHS